MTRVYFAGPLFTQAEWQWNANIAAELRRLSLDIVLPQERATSMLSGVEPFDAAALFDNNVAGIESSDAVIAVLDQADPDSGTCWECGYAHKAGIPIIGLRTDFRASGDDAERPANLMIARSCSEFINLPYDKRGDTAWLVQQIVESVKRVVSAK